MASEALSFSYLSSPHRGLTSFLTTHSHFSSPSRIETVAKETKGGINQTPSPPSLHSTTHPSYSSISPLSSQSKTEKETSKWKTSSDLERNLYHQSQTRIHLFSFTRLPQPPATSLFLREQDRRLGNFAAGSILRGKGNFLTYGFLG